MNFAAAPCLRIQPELAAKWEPRIICTEYDPRFIPAHQKPGVLIGMAMTERQGGSDVRANTTRAKPLERGVYEITGHKWFCSAPMCDAFLILAQAPKGLSCFLLPRWKADGTRNAFDIMRLKDKLGNRSNASGEVEFHGAFAQRVGEAMECLGGNGYVEESALTRLYRDAPVNSIWEGCGNVQCLDVLRAIDHDRGTLEVVLHEIRSGRSASRQFDAFVDRLELSWQRRPMLNSERGGPWNGWRSLFKARCSFNTRRQLLPRLSVPRDWRATKGLHLGLCRLKLILTPSSSGRGQKYNIDEYKAFDEQNPASAWRNRPCDRRRRDHHSVDCGIRSRESGDSLQDHALGRRDHSADETTTNAAWVAWRCPALCCLRGETPAAGHCRCPHQQAFVCFLGLSRACCNPRDFAGCLH